jgi:hypothetical protein
LPDDEDKVKQELEKARETLNSSPITKSETFDEL